MHVEQIFGFPLVAAENIYAVLHALGIMEWEDAAPTQPLENFVATGNDEDRAFVQRFAPKTEVWFLKHPVTGAVEPYFRGLGRAWQSTFLLLEGRYVVLIAEWKHGSRKISLAPPSAVPNGDDRKTDDPFRICSLRETERETGIAIKDVLPLAKGPIPVTARQREDAYMPFLGVLPAGPVAAGEPHLRANEYFKTIVMEVTEWMKLIESGEVWEDCSISITLLALRKLGLLSLL